MSPANQLNILVPTTGVSPQLLANLALARQSPQSGGIKWHVAFDGYRLSQTEERETRQDGLKLYFPSAAKRRGPAFVRNFLAKQVTAGWLCFMDADVRILEDSFEKLTTALSTLPKTGVLVPRIEGEKSGGVSDFFDDYILSPLYRTSGEIIVPSATFVIHSDVWKLTGGFDERFTGAGGEDWAFFHKIQSPEISLDIFLAPNWVVKHQNPATLKALWQRAKRYAAQNSLANQSISRPFRPWAVVFRRLLRFLAVVRNIFGSQRVGPGMISTESPDAQEQLNSEKLVQMYQRRLQREIETLPVGAVLRKRLQRALAEANIQRVGALWDLLRPAFSPRGRVLFVNRRLGHRLVGFLIHLVWRLFFLGNTSRYGVLEFLAQRNARELA